MSIYCENKQNILENSIGNKKHYCEGMFSSYRNLGNYILGIQLTAAKEKISFSHDGSDLLDGIIAYDSAEIKEANLGQINMIKVSSFCGPKGLIWGYDICTVDQQKLLWNLHVNNDIIPVYSLENLCEALKTLYGTVDFPRFPLLPGSHVPCAAKYIVSKGEKIIYAAEGIGIPRERDRHACLLMEDVGEIPLKESNSIEKYKQTILKNLILSVLKIGRNQRIFYHKIFVGIKELYVGENEMGCAMAVSPYFCLAAKAIPRDYNLLDLSLNQWEKICKKDFIYNQIT